MMKTDPPPSTSGDTPDATPKPAPTAPTAPPVPSAYEGLAAIAQALGHAHRVQLLIRAAREPQSVEVLASACALSVANASRHLQVLRRAGLVTGSRRGKQVCYGVTAGSDVRALLQGLGSLAHRQARERQQLVADSLQAPDTLEAITRDELARRLRDGVVTLLDVRPADEYGRGHLPGAMNLPIDELENHLARLPRDQAFVAYCRGAYCVLSSEAVLRLGALGYRVRRLEDGFAEWQAAGLAIETG